jgi:hypothetical protein
VALTSARPVLLGLSVVTAAALSSCANGEAALPPSTEAIGAPYSVQDSVELFAGIDLDYDPLPSPTALAGRSDVVVTGTIERVQEGRDEISPANENVVPYRTIVLVLRDANAVVGSLEPATDGFVYIELPNPGQREPSAYQDGLFAGSSVVAYLVPAFDGELAEGSDVGIANAGAGRPAGQALYQPSGPQGLILQHDADPVVWPLIGEVRDGILEEALPSGELIAP